MIPIRDSTARVGSAPVTRALIVLNLVIFAFTGYVLSDRPDSRSAVIGIPSNDAAQVQGYLVTEESGVFLRFGAVPELITGELENTPRTRTVVERQGIDLLPGLLILLTPLTAMFLHGGLLHVGGNMLFLWVFGDNVEDRMGSARFLIFYLLTGYFAAAAHIFIDSGDLVPMIGASGATSGILGAYFLLYPRALVQVLIPVFFLIPAVVPATLMIGFWFLLNLLPGLGSVVSDRGATGTAWWAHIGGFAAGLLLIYPFLLGRWKAPAHEVTPTWNVPRRFGFGFGARSEIPQQGRLRSDPPPRSDPPADSALGSDAQSGDEETLHRDVTLPEGWQVMPASDPPKKRGRFGMRGRRPGGRRAGGVDAFRDRPKK